jgi:excisionase family DNA binding protein
LAAPSPLRLADLPDILTPEEVAGLMRVDTQCIYRLIREGVFPAVHVGRNPRVPKDRFLRFLEGGEA